MLSFDSSKYNEEFFGFIHENRYADPAKLLLSSRGESTGIDVKEAAIQIACRRKCSLKLPSFLSNDRFLFPDSISSEQASDERVARFHSRIVGRGKSVIDLTAGLGIDGMTIAMNGNKVIAIELNDRKASVLEYNAGILSIEDFRVINSDCQVVINSIKDFPDYFFIDPARRASDNRRTYAFKDCLPDITSKYKKLISQGSTLLIKASPLLDISSIIGQFEDIVKIYAVAVKGECKELLIEIAKRKDEFPNIQFIAVDLASEGIISKFSFLMKEDDNATRVYEGETLPSGWYLYEPNAALMKFHACSQICKSFPDLQKASTNTEVYVSERLYSDFPGRIVRITGILSSGELKKISGERFSVVVRNYPSSSEEIRKKYKFKESESKFIYGIRLGIKNKPVLIEGEKITGGA